MTPRPNTMIQRYILAAVLCGAIGAHAQGTSATETKPEFSVRPTGRLLVDAAAFAGNAQGLFKPGLGVPEARLGAAASYGKWDVRIEVGYAYGKVGLKDMAIGYDFDGMNSLRVGSFIQQYGYQSGTSASMKITMNEPLSSVVANNSRYLGIMYTHSSSKWFNTISFHAEPNAMILAPNQMDKQGYGFLSRQVWHPYTEPGRILSIGLSGGFATPQYNEDKELNHHTFTLAGNFPVSVDRVPALSATVAGAMNQWKFTPEIAAAYGPVALEAQYFYNQVNRRHSLPAFRGQGGYVNLRTLLLDGQYEYSLPMACIAMPKPGQLECVMSYNYTTLTDAKAGVWGGRFSDLSCTFNYYINPYMIFRFRYSYAHRWDSAVGPTVDLSSFAARIQFQF